LSSIIAGLVAADGPDSIQARLGALLKLVRAADQDRVDFEVAEFLAPYGLTQGDCSQLKDLIWSARVSLAQAEAAIAQVRAIEPADQHLAECAPIPS
jgi:hypothetical protein